MNDKEKQITEFINYLRECSNNAWAKGFDYVELDNEELRELLALFPKDSVVLSKEEYEKLTYDVRNDVAVDIIRAIFEMLDWSKHTNSFEKGILKLISEYSMDLEIEQQARKETAKEILTDLYNYACLRVKNGVANIDADLLDIVNKANEYGIDLGKSFNDYEGE